jgi:essential nuclear protein 1
MTENWEELLNITEPFNWTPAAMYEATIKFSSSEVLMTNIFYEKYLLPAIRNDIKIHKKLNVHYYNCLKRCIFKPSAFFKGIIFPLSKNLSSKEAAIIGSILRKCSIPVNHSSAALIELIKLCKNGKNGISFGALYFMKILLMKKYAFPIFVKEELCKFFLSYENFKEKLPVMFHQVLLIFVQFYKLDLTPDEKNKLKIFNEKKGHYAIQNEINKELNYNSNNKMQIE